MYIVWSTIASLTVSGGGAKVTLSISLLPALSSLHIVLFFTYFSGLSFYLFFKEFLCQTFCFAWLDPKVKQMHLFSNDFRMRQYFMQNISLKINADALLNYF